MTNLEELGKDVEQFEEARKRAMKAVVATAKGKQTARIDKADVEQRMQNWYTAIRLASMLGFTNREIGEAAGVSEVRISQIISGRKGRDGRS